jgi:hypothetical protein
MGKVRLRPRYAEEARMLAEMNLPIAMAQAKVAEEVARQNMAVTRCARETALREAQRARREAERAQREAMRMRERMAHNNASPMPTANADADVDQRDEN